MFALAVTIGFAREREVERLEGVGPVVKRWGGRILILAGLWLILLAAFADFFAGIFPV